MKVQVSIELLKAILFWHQRNYKKADRLCSRCLQPLFQNQISFILLPLFFKEYLHPQVRVNKMLNKHSANYHSSPSGLSSRIHPPIFLKSLHASYLSKIFVQFCLTCISHPGWEIFSNLWCWDYWKIYFACQKIESRYFYSCLPKQNSPPGSYHHFQAEVNSHSSSRCSVFFRKSVSPSAKRGRGRGRKL